MIQLEGILLWLGVGGYVLSILAYLVGLIFKKEKAAVWGFWFISFGFILHTVSIATRWIVTGHPPVIAGYEHSLFGSWFIILLFFTIRIWLPKIELFGIAIIPFALFVLGNGIMTASVHEPLSPPYQSNWLWVHITFAWFAYGSFSVAAAIAILYLLRVGIISKFLERLPEPEILDDLIFRFIFFGFISLTIEVGAGAIWAKGLWGRYWGWDPVETWSLISWLTYGINLHLRTTLGWQGSKAAWLTIISFVAIIITFFGIGFVVGIHTQLL
ncbi:MAG: hypothetical protein A3G39_04345 [Deltaproteobacteria bacterium RIFCSPLOWO2_12_FULL_43_16]|nr:MAG: hypothetical protein A2Z89_04395 [Deltaproteobacteria bacterium GWA2_43_19]OGQ11076.1 MAG: hypothetical protein A3D30_00475 [Deltaproteobacteria bacterium RIFCSPHIGHO2_02_FULL_43_33]OGQ34457.1 MAG: hypothetical protein A3A85_05835 [Deltaproteobacteria bacterium RIFCSPLOWO2_01_FULL_42_9]OGQ60320.1 MAG: hypothetical protein A3G39_04345 [Deltaproteobacteria bacterium RIFCSPLOWO2_12_FULL_43_16]HBR18493.1 cytochrome C biogenesis protein [Deltaproteobacteria bacterium]